MLALQAVKETASKVAWAIKKILDADVIVVDSDLVRIADTFVYLRQQIQVRTDSIIGRVIRTGTPIAVDDKRGYVACINCPDAHKCEMRSVVGVPIFAGTTVVGAIGLIVPIKNRQVFFANIAHTFDFLAKMAELLSGRLQIDNVYEQQANARREREALAAMNDWAVVSVDSAGEIQFCNRCFEQSFTNGATAEGMQLGDILRSDTLRKALEDGEQTKNAPITFFCGNAQESGFYSVTNLAQTGALIEIRTLEMLARSASHRMADMPRLGGFDRIVHRSAGIRRAIKAARLLAPGDQAILLEGPGASLAWSFAAAIYETSGRSTHGFFCVDVEGRTEESIRAELFGSEKGGQIALGRLFTAFGGTLLLKGADRISHLLQEEIAEYIRTGQARFGNVSHTTNVRLILYSGSRRSSKPHTDAYLSPELLDAIDAENTVFLPAPDADSEDIAAHIDYFVGYYCALHGRGKLRLKPELMQALQNSSAAADIALLGTVIESMVRCAKADEIGSEMLSKLPFRLSGAGRRNTIEEKVCVEINQLLQQGYGYTDIAKKLGISRSTLYRKIKRNQEKVSND